MKTEQQEQESTNSLIPKVEPEERQSGEGGKAKAKPKRKQDAKRQLLKTAEEIKKYNSIKKIKRAE